MLEYLLSSKKKKKKKKKNPKNLGLFSPLTISIWKEAQESEAFTHLVNFLVLRALSCGFPAFPTSYSEPTNPYTHRIFEVKDIGAPLYLAQRHEMVCQSHAVSSPDTTLFQ